MSEFVNFYLFPALTIGSIYALGAVGISMIFGILRFAHFAHGDLMTLGTYGILAAAALLPVNPLLLVPFAMAMTIFAALFVDRFFYRPLRDLPTIYTVISSFGIALVFRSIVQLIWGSENQVLVAGVSPPLVLFDTFRVSILHLQAIVTTAVIAVLLHYFLTATRTGRSMRAVADDPELAEVSGLDTAKVVRWTWIIGAALAAIAGAFAALNTSAHPNLGWNLLLPMFAAAILGGIGKPMGAMAGGFIIGTAEELSSYHWIGDSALISPSYKTAVAFVIMIGLLIFRPQGLFKGRLL
ncbi:branched-chain amino acid ABC transporter permease [Roseibium sp. SCP14]|uniref:branched-chain amino acid ABC transporter permease n=1 Tax=Roseibium sp. SCP14 TaxID=3141375 RepID=UPI003339D5CA